MTRNQINVYIDTRRKTFEISFPDLEIKHKLHNRVFEYFFFNPWVDWEKDAVSCIEYCFNLLRAWYDLVNKPFPKYIKIIKTNSNILGGLDEDSDMRY